MGSMLNTSPNSSSISTAKAFKAKPAKASTALALGVVAALLGGVFASPASAKTTVQGGQTACKAAFQAQTPAPTSLRVDTNQTRAQNDTLVYAYKVKAPGDDNVTNVTCTVDRTTNTATLSMEAAPPTTLATR